MAGRVSKRNFQKLCVLWTDQGKRKKKKNVRNKTSLVVQMVKRLPAMQETLVWSLGQEDPLEKEMATHSSTLGKFHGWRSLVGHSPWDCKELEMTEQLHNDNEAIKQLLSAYLVFMLTCSVAKSCVTLWDLMGCSPPGSSVHVISQARILEQVAISFSKESFWPRDQTCISYSSCIGRWNF